MNAVPASSGYPGIDLGQLRVFPLASRKSLTQAEEILIDVESAPPACAPRVEAQAAACAGAILAARRSGATVMLIYGAHLLRNGAALILDAMMSRGWLTHLATNGASTIHDWEYSFLGRSTESVRENVADGTFGAWDETGRFIHLALYAGGVAGEGYGQALGRLITEDRVTLPDAAMLRKQLQDEPGHPLAPARAELLQALFKGAFAEGRVEVIHRWKNASILGHAFRRHVPLTVHPGIGYDIISNHPLFNGAVIGRAATTDFRVFGHAVENLTGGVVLSVGSAIMGPQVFEKSLSCVNNLRLQQGLVPIRGHQIYVVDLQDGGNWDWTTGEPPKTNPAYYLRFCKSFARMGGEMTYVQADNAAFIHRLYHDLLRLA